MAARWVAAAILLVMSAIIGIFLWAIIRPPSPPVEGAAGTPVAAETRVEFNGASLSLSFQAISL